MPQQQMPQQGFGMQQQQQQQPLGFFGMQQQQQPMQGFGMQQPQMGQGGAPNLFKSW